MAKFNNRIKAYTDCKTREEFEAFMFEKYIESEIIKCSCDESFADSFRDAYGHYQHCNYWNFCHGISRALDWSEKKAKKDFDLLKSEIGLTIEQFEDDV